MQIMQMSTTNVNSIIKMSPSSKKYSFSCTGTKIDVTITNSAAVVKTWLQQQLDLSQDNKSLIVGLDCKEKASAAQRIKIATLQLCFGTNCLIFQLYRMDYIPQLLKNFFNDPNVTFVGFDLGLDVTNLRIYFSLSCANAVDILQMAQRRYPDQSFRGLEILAETFAGLTVSAEPMHLFLSDWEARELSAQQIERACIDAYAPWKIGRALIRT